MRFRQMTIRNRSVLVTAVVLVMAAVVPPSGAGTPQTSYDDLLVLFREFRDFRRPAMEDGAPDYSAAAMAEHFAELRKFQQRLAAIDST